MIDKYPGWLRFLVAMTGAIVGWAVIVALGWTVLVGW